MQFSLYGCVLLVSLLALPVPLAAQDLGVTQRSTTWQQDSPTICAGCVYRTGQNLGETKILRLRKPIQKANRFASLRMTTFRRKGRLLRGCFASLTSHSAQDDNAGEIP
jgi:hypothetical protein